MIVHIGNYLVNTYVQNSKTNQNHQSSMKWVHQVLQLGLTPITDILDPGTSFLGYLF